MQKALELLERYVQWIALGIGVLFLGWMAFSYLAMPPLTVAVGSTELQPGDVDPHIEKTSVATLKQQMSSGGINIRVQDPVPGWKEKMIETVTPTAQRDTHTGDPTTQPKTTQPSGSYPLPILVKAEVGLRSSGRSTLSYLDPTYVPDEKKPAPAVLPTVTADHDWNSMTFRFNMAALRQAFEAAGIPASNITTPELNFNKTQFLQVYLIRQEKLPDGTWSPAAGQLIAPLPIYKFPPLPAEGKAGDQYLYLEKLKDLVPSMLQPPFVTVTVGQPWYWPGAAAPPMIVGDPAAAAGAGGIPAPDEALRRAGAPRVPPPAGVGVIPDRFGLRAAPPPAAPLAPPPLIPAGPAGEGGAPPAAEVLPGSGDTNSEFDPSVPEAVDFHFLAHDITCQAGKTYRYKLRYVLKNPLWQKNGPNISPVVSARFALTSPDSDWTPEFTPPPRLKFWVVKADKAKGVDVDVYVWAAGRWQVQHLKELQPGDAVGTSPWTVVDVRTDPAVRNPRPYALLTDQNGQTRRRDPKLDWVDAEHQKLRDELGGAALAP